MQENKNAIRVSDPERSFDMGLHQLLDEKSYKPVYEAFTMKDQAKE